MSNTQFTPGPNRWIFQIPLSDVQTGDASGGKCPCLLCGREILGTPTYYVHLLTNGNLVSTDQQFSEKEDQGFFLIGIKCINKLPNNFVFKLHDIMNPNK
jgi:hypothetical protein